MITHIQIKVIDIIMIIMIIIMIIMIIMIMIIIIGRRPEHGPAALRRRRLRGAAAAEVRAQQDR